MKTIAIDAWNQTGINEVSQTCRSAATGQERNDADIKVAILKKTISFEPGILKREGNENRLNIEVGTTLRSQMGDNQTAVMSFSAKPGEMIRLSDSPKMSKEVSNTLTRSDGKLGDNQPTVVAFAQNTRDEVRIVGDGQVSSALAAQQGTHQTTYITHIGKWSGVECLCPSQPQTHRIYGSQGVMPALMANTGKAGQDQSAILKTNTSNTTTQNNTKPMKAEVRRLTPTEVQRLQGFDEGHLDVNNQGDSAIYSETGNSWAVNNARFVLKGIHKVDAKLKKGLFT